VLFKRSKITKNNTQKLDFLCNKDKQIEEDNLISDLREIRNLLGVIGAGPNNLLDYNSNIKTRT